METLTEYIWIPILIFLTWICYRLWKAGKYRDPGQENTYFDIMKGGPYVCPYKLPSRSCKDPNCPDGYIKCDSCDWYNNGVRSSKF